jgi:transcriptional regulator with XRE-family HTH domain
VTDFELIVRTRLRSLRQSQSLSLAELASLAHLSASTISRIETGKRTISLDILVPLARALGTNVDTLLTHDIDEDVVIRAEPSHEDSRTTWMLSKTTGSVRALKVRLEPSRRIPEQKVHPGHDWFFVLEGRVCLYLGERAIIVEKGEAAEFQTMTPHTFAAEGGPAEMLMVFGEEGHIVHRYEE